MARYAKAATAALTAAAGAAVTALTDSTISPQEWVTIAAAGLGALGVTWAVPNRQPTA